MDETWYGRLDRGRPGLGMRGILILFLALLPEISIFAAPDFEAIKITQTEGGGQTYTVTLQVLMLMTVMSFIPAMLLTMTAFVRITIVLHFIRQALGTMQTPSNQVLVALALFLTFYIMKPVFDRIHDDAVLPYLEDKITMQQAVLKGAVPLRGFMLNQTRETDLALFIKISRHAEEFKDAADVPFSILIPAFIISEIKTAFQIGFLIFIPFLIIDLVVATTLMSMGMMMLSPMMISLPFKLMLFVMIDGWSMVIGTLTASFYMGE